MPYRCLGRRNSFCEAGLKSKFNVFPSSVGPDAPGTGRADCFDGGVHLWWPIIQRIENMMHLGMALVMYLGMGALDERLLVLHRVDDPLIRVSIRGDSQ